ncbi:MAG: hypothetical protein O3B74_06355 [Proteobacteria bacterium]|nr:hypothetical protein [Pseudomonadota bacterium]
MTKLVRIFLIVAATASFSLVTVAPVYAASDQEEVDESTKDRKLKEKEQKKRDKKFNDDRLYRYMIGPDVLSVGPFTISLYVRGQLVEGRLRIAIQAKDRQAKSALENEKWAINGIVYPLALRMWENGRPKTEDIRNFKIDSRTQLQRRYRELVTDVFIESIM